MTVPVKFQVAVVDFIERVGSTAAEAGLAVYLTQKTPDVATIAVAAGAAVGKYLLIQLAAWQKSHGVS